MRIGIALALLVLAGCVAELRHDLDENTANDVVSVLHEHGVAADKVRHGRGSWAVTVPHADRSRAWNIVRDAGLADEPPEADAELMPSPAQRRASLAGRKAARLEGSLEMLAGVADARVHLNLPANRRVRIPGVAPASPRASVLLRVRGQQAGAATAARDLVVGAVEDMQPEDVKVVTVSAPTVPEATPALVPLGPLAVSADSAGAVKGLLGGLAGAVALLAVVVVALVLRLRRARIP